MPKGRANNPQGKNQWAGDRSRNAIGVRLPQWMDRLVRKEAQRSGKSLTQIAEEAFGLWLEKQLMQEDRNAAQSTS